MSGATVILDVRCAVCKRRPEEIAEYVDMAKAERTTPRAFVLAEEGTYNPKDGAFACTDCYIKIGMPVGTRGRRWVAQHGVKYL